MGRLSVYRGSARLRSVDLSGQSIRIGRGAQNDLVLPDPDKTVSRLHAELRAEGSTFVIADLGSQNGTWVDGHRIERGVLGAGVPVLIGPYRLVIECAGEKRDSAPTSLVAVDQMAEADGAPADLPPRVADPEPRVAAARQPPRRGRGPLRAGIGGRLWWPLVPVSIGTLVVGVLVLTGLVTRSFRGGAPSAPPAPPVVSVLAGAGAPTGVLEEPTVAVSQPPESTEPGLGTPAERIATTEAARAVVPRSTDSPASRASGGAGPRSPRTSSARPSAPVAATPEPGAVARRPGEPSAVWRARTRQVQDWYRLGTSALRAGELSTAIVRFEMILREEPGYLNTAALLEQARNGRQAAAREVFEEGARVEQAGDYLGAIRLYDQARTVNPLMPGIDEAIEQARGKATAEGQSAYGRARQYDALGRISEAITQYERAAQMLPAHDPLRKAAKDRADVLRSGGR